MEGKTEGAAKGRHYTCNKTLQMFAKIGTPEEQHAVLITN